MPGVSLPWYAIGVKWRTEKAVFSALTHKGYECFLPLYDSARNWSDRLKTVSVPLFPGYLFARLNIQQRLPILMTPNVFGIVGTGKIPAIVDEEEVESVRLVLRNRLPVEPWNLLEPGDPVEVVHGPLTGLEGIFVRYRGTARLVLSITLIGRAVAVEIDTTCVKRLNAPLLRYSSFPAVGQAVAS